MINLKDYQKTERALQPRYEGPFEVIKQLSPVTFKLLMPERYRAIHPVFHASKLAPYNQSEVVGQKSQPPPPTLIDGQLEYEVEKILQRRKVGRSYQYLVRWKGYGREDDTWEPLSNLTKAKELVDEFNSNKVRVVTVDELTPMSVLTLKQE